MCVQFLWCLPCIVKIGRSATLFTAAAQRLQGLFQLFGKTNEGMEIRLWRLLAAVVNNSRNQSMFQLIEVIITIR